MKSLAGPFPIYPKHLDEVGTLLSRVPRFPVTRPSETDARYTLETAVAELQGWLEGPLNPRQRAADHASMVADVARAFSARGHNVVARSGAAETLIVDINSLRPQDRHRNPA
jgi:hypothetical protein